MIEVDSYFVGTYPIMFRAEQSKRALVYLPGYYAKPGKVSSPSRRGILYSTDGETFYTCVTSGERSLSQGGEKLEMTFTFSVPHLNIEKATLTYNREGDSTVVDGELFIRQDKEDQPAAEKIVPLPDKRDDVYHLIGDGIQIYVDTWSYADSFDTYRLFFNCEQLNILDIRRLRDGGTTHITTDRGVLFVPSRFGRDPSLCTNPTWTDRDANVFALKDAAPQETSG